MFLSSSDVSSLFPKHSGLALTLLEGCYSGGAFVFFAFKALYFNYNVSFRTLFISYAILSGLVALLQLFFWPWSKFSDRTQRVSTIDEYDEVPGEEQTLVNETKEKTSYLQGVSPKIEIKLTRG
jgi:hypothetical protein